MTQKIKTIIFFLIFSIKALGEPVPVPDPAFLEFLKTNYPTTIDENDRLVPEEAAMIWGFMNCSNIGVEDLEGVQYFTRITRIYATSNNLKRIPDISGLTGLEELNVRDNKLKELPSLSSFAGLKRLIIYNNELIALPDLSSNKALEQIVAYGNRLESVPDFSNLEKLVFLEIGNNNITYIPDMHNLPSLKDFYCYLNDLERLPQMSGFNSLSVLNAGSNRLKVAPNLSGAPLLKNIIIDNNELTELPDVSMLPLLDSMDVYENRLSFTELTKVKSHPFLEKFNLAPQKTFETGINVSVVETNPIYLSSEVDNGLDQTTYEWFLNGNSFKTADNHKLIINSTEFKHAGSYYCKITHKEMPGIELFTNTFNLSVTPCINVDGLSYSVERTECNRAGSLKVEPSSVKGSGILFTLSSPFSDKSMTSETGVFSGLNKPEYTLLITSERCSKDYSETIYIPKEDCEEVILTPFSGGENSSYWFSQSGNVKIYNKNGIIVKSLAIPNDWDASGNNGLVNPGYYVADINNGETFVNITVIY